MRGQAPGPCTHAGALLWHPGSDLGDLAESTTPVPVGRTGFTAFAPPRGERWRPCVGGSPRTWGEPRDEPCGGSRCLRCPGTGPNRGGGRSDPPPAGSDPSACSSQEARPRPGAPSRSRRGTGAEPSRGPQGLPSPAGRPGKPSVADLGGAGGHSRPPRSPTARGGWGCWGQGVGPVGHPVRPGPGVRWVAAAPGGQSAGLSGRGAAGPGGDPRERGGGQRTPAGRGTVWKFLA